MNGLALKTRRSRNAVLNNTTKIIDVVMFGCPVILPSFAEYHRLAVKIMRKCHNI